MYYIILYVGILMTFINRIKISYTRKQHIFCTCQSNTSLLTVSGATTLPVY